MAGSFLVDVRGHGLVEVAPDELAGLEWDRPWRYAPLDLPADVALSDSWAYVVRAPGFVTAYDLGSPADVRVHEIDLGQHVGMARELRVAAAGHWLLVGGGSTLLAVELDEHRSASAQSTWLGCGEVGLRAALYQDVAIAPRGDEAYYVCNAPTNDARWLHTVRLRPGARPVSSAAPLRLPDHLAHAFELTLAVGAEHVVIGEPDHGPPHSYARTSSGLSALGAIRPPPDWDEGEDPTGDGEFDASSFFILDDALCVMDDDWPRLYRYRLEPGEGPKHDRWWALGGLRMSLAGAGELIAGSGFDKSIQTYRVAGADLEPLAFGAAWRDVRSPGGIDYLVPAALAIDDQVIVAVGAGYRLVVYRRPDLAP